MDKPRRQEQEPASEEITEVAPSILRLQLPIELPGLGHVNCYALEDDRGFALVDPGLPGPQPWKVIVRRLGQAGIPLARVHTVVVTHSHPDHYGGAGRLRNESGADVLTHRSFRTWWDPADDDLDNADAADAHSAARPGPWDQPPPWGGEPYQPPMRMKIARTMMEERKLMATPSPSRRVDDADVVQLAGREWVAVHTPGHTPDHLCLLDPANAVMLSGDHVLPTITPHISGLGNAPDPLAEFFRSLDRMGELGNVTTVLPAHGHPFNDLAGRAKAIRHHHEERLEKLRAASHELDQPATVTELSHHLFSPRAWGSMADSETYAHLEHLRILGQATRRDVDGFATYVVD
jgi:glyoxylase-like metal-dependent hydrolase (beta-lactamase superfamily II)